MTSALGLRAEAARELVRSRELSPETALYLTVWPPAKLEEATAGCKRRNGTRTAEEKARALELLASGMSHADVGRELGIHRTTISLWARSNRSVSVERVTSPR